MNRKEFLKTAFWGGAGLTLLPTASFASAAENVPNEALETVSGDRPVKCLKTHLIKQFGTPAVFENEKADELVNIASLTKLMTLSIVFEHVEAGTLNPEDILSIPRSVRDQTWTSGFYKISVDQAMRLAAVKSFNDAAIMLARKIAGSEQKFVRDYMAPKAKELGMSNTKFYNASGLPLTGRNSRGKYYRLDSFSTANEVALLCEHIWGDYPEHSKIFEDTKIKTGPRRGNEEFENSNPFLLGAEGERAAPYTVNNRTVNRGKSGWLSTAGHNFAAVAQDPNLGKILVVATGFQSWEERNEEMPKFFDQGFEELAKRRPVNALKFLQPVPLVSYF
ncbi:MAG: D-alanyl-D-alanine carboxypeptidase [Alphaproteobacteria bacterium]|nr:D-alanyl-D-alanine carboxypeptidase [Alphaproteobacteria bacterium]